MRGAESTGSDSGFADQGAGALLDSDSASDDLRGGDRAPGDTASVDQALLSYYVYRLFGAVMPLVPPRVGYGFFVRLGDLAYSGSKPSRDNVHDNLRKVLGPRADSAQVARVARQIFRNQARNYYDLFRVASLTREGIERLVRVHGWEHVEQALAAGRGMVLVTAHFGNLDIVAQILGLRQYPVTAVAEHLRPEKLYQYVVSLRASKGVHLVSADGFLRPLFRALRRNEIVGLAADRNLAGTGTLVDFFGVRALLPDGGIRLALHTGARVVPAFGLRRADNTFDTLVEPPLDLENTGDVERDVHLGMARLVAVLEKYIGRYPEQWVMFQPVWRLPAQRPPLPAQDVNTAEP